MLAHLCLINLKDRSSLDETSLQAIIDAYNQLPQLIPGIQSFSVGWDAGLLQGNADLAIYGTFDSAEAFQAYSVHPAHGEVIFPVLGEHMESYSTAQFEI